jgi:diguanylate cyclase (GGDEF)-like protein
MKLFFKSSPETLDAFHNYRLKAMRPVIKALFITIAVFNALLLIPDLIHLGGAAGIAVIALRSGFTIMTLVGLIGVLRLRSFHAYAMVVTILEAAALVIFLSVFYLYPEPDYTIQMVGMMVILMLIYLMPNKWSNMLIVSGAGVAGFLCASLFFGKNIDAGHILAGNIYLVVISALCAIFALHYRSYQYREYVSKAELLRDYTTDPLTGIGNRVKLEEEATKWLDRAERYGLPLSLVVIDVDNMKEINDTYGHIVGDTTLYDVAQVMRAQLRKDDVCVRWGGDEFVLLLPYTGVLEARKLMERVQTAISSHAFKPSTRLTCSFGIAPMQAGQNLDTLIEQADQSMYEAKRMGKNRIRTSDTTAENHASRSYHSL